MEPKTTELQERYLQERNTFPLLFLLNYNHRTNKLLMNYEVNHVFALLTGRAKPPESQKWVISRPSV